MNKLEKYEGKDRIVGRPIRLNRFELPVKNGKDYAELLAFGDLHHGHPQCRVDKAKEMLDWALQHNVAVLLMGDLLEAGLRDSVGDSVYRQKLNPQEQMEAVVDLLQPLANKGLIKGLLSGNHEERITKTTGIDVSKVMARLLNVPYLGYACWNMVIVGKQKYAVYSEHGTGGSRFKHTKLKKILDEFAWLRADLILMGHHHSLDSTRVTIQEVDFRNKQVKEKKCYGALTGSYIGWDKSYAQMHELPISEIGSPKIKFSSVKRRIWISF